MTYRVIDINTREVLSADTISTIKEAREVADEIEQHKSKPEVEIQQLIDGAWVKTN